MRDEIKVSVQLLRSVERILRQVSETEGDHPLWSEGGEGRLVLQQVRTYTENFRPVEPGRAMAQELADFVNSMLPEVEVKQFIEEIVDRTHRTLQQSIMRYIVLGLIEAWAERYENERDMYFDARNEATGKLASAICNKFDKHERHLPYI